MLTHDFNYELPKKQIALHPAMPRDHARLMILERTKKNISDHYFYELKDLLKEGDLLVANNSKVMPARLFGKNNSGKKIEVLLLRPININTWKCLVKGGKEKELDFGLMKGTISRINDDFCIKFSLEGELLINEIHKIGHMPLPPYIQNLRPEIKKDKIDYQTIYAKEEGSAAAPTAGLHFTKRLLRELDEKGVEIEFVTLHVGAGTFQPVKTDVVEEHKMHSEYFEISKETAIAINKAKREGRRIIAVGTTAIRALEAAASTGHYLVTDLVTGVTGSDPAKQPRQACQGSDPWQIGSGSGWTDIFIYPGYEFKVVDGLITNFHLPKSSLLMLVAAFAGKKFTLEAYETAVKKGYRFYSYGDAMLIL